MRRSNPTRHSRASVGRSTRLLLVLALLVSGLTSVVGLAGTPRAEAADNSQFRAGNIISDRVFFDTTTMSIAQIQAFLDFQGTRCSDAYCLKHINLISVTKAADAYCAGYSSPGYEKAATIIWKVAQSCGVNPQVILVMLQKEQGLVTTTAPNDTKYRAAMGMGCPDTAACDSQYYGFANQVYAGVRQMRVYELSGRYTWNRPGTTVNVRFHPNAACGTSPVYIENQATANLYYYTPYQPNAASLAAGAGTGDACSSYGNRNFYRYFTDWFGTTQGGSVRLAKGSSSSVYLIDGVKRWHVTAEAYPELLAILGPLFSVGDSFINRLPDGGVAAGVFLRNSMTGEISMAQGGSLHRFSSCETLARWGGSCSSYVDAHPAMFAGVTYGEPMSDWMRVAGTSTWARFTGASSVQPYLDESSARALEPTTPTYAAQISAARYASLTKARTLVGPARLVKEPSSAQVWLTDGSTTLHPVPDFAVSTDLGVASSSLTTLPASDLAGYTRAATPLSTIVTCSGVTYVAGSGRLHALSTPARAGTSGTGLQPVTCAQLDRSGAAIPNVPLVKASGSDVVSSLEDGRRWSVRSWSDAQVLGGATNPVIVTIRPGSLARIPDGGVRLGDATLVKGSGPEVLAVTGLTTLARIPSFAMAREWGIATTFATVADSAVTSRTKVADLGLWGTCGSATVVAASGTVHVVTGSSAGFTPAAWSTEACARFSRSGTTLARVFVKAASSDVVYLAENGAYRPVQSWAALVRANGGTSPQILTSANDVVAGLPKGAPLS
ncbi:hypothetical protein [Aeromicrobium sp.]|uniref:hypothetical protein n=1 Tax=Aeromicrobium sp. TaxID=1871063 RepID=UPI0025C39806|nr:hypothetical protein [Aeromicrobium sp.]MCK5891273.1 hypothetical protein [Aeromicrobium sp.]